jgi:hypothetical protein
VIAELVEQALSLPIEEAAAHHSAQRQRRPQTSEVGILTFFLQFLNIWSPVLGFNGWIVVQSVTGVWIAG